MYVEPKRNSGRLLIVAVVLLLACCCALACGLIAIELYLSFGQGTPSPAPKPSSLLPFLLNWIS
jgi:hypothetical protein